ncbi:MAG: TIGR03067 domain-containing protein [Planctomycetaceae bacterium]|nr:MAG: TIGR03067 domain-containing protein [Planctomycetaceae bacterium]
MSRSSLSIGIAGCLFLFSLSAQAQEAEGVQGVAPAANEAAREDRAWIVGTWRVTELQINGNRGKPEDIRPLTVTNEADGTWVLRSAGKEISRGTSTIDPTKTPKTIDFTPTSGGGVGEKYRGIYEYGKTTRKMCFAPAAKERPTDYTAAAGSERISLSFERVPKL